MGRTYMVKWGGLSDGEMMMFAGLQAAIKKANEKKGMVYIVEGGYTKEVDGIKIYDHLNQNVDENNE